MDNSSLLTSLGDDAEWTKKTTANARNANDQNETGNHNANHGCHTEKKMLLSLCTIFSYKNLLV
jgi:hypothetical protein